jgi:hypothetical protein
MASRILLCMLCVALIVKSESVAAQTEPQSNYGAFVKKQQSDLTDLLYQVEC